MPEATISFANHDQIRTLFGAHDQFLRQVRERVGVEVVLRGDEIRLHGTEDQVQRAVEVFTELRRIVESKGRLHLTEVSDVLRANAVEAEQTASGESIDLFEKAKRVHPKTAGQARYVDAMRGHDMVFCSGPAGCGKTYLAVAMAINALRQQHVRKIVLVRPAVEAGEKLGFLPGDIFAKVNPYLRPLLDALADMLDFEQVRRYMERDVIEIVPLAFMRGRTLNHTFIILDEGQNTTVTQMKMFLTRMGIESKIVVTGDVTQNDLPENITSGLVDAMRRLRDINGVAAVELSGQDIVRHRLVREVVEAYDQDSGNPPRRP
jgi:phosphate starvation-inducible PhoH-like protein